MDNVNLLTMMAARLVVGGSAAANTAELRDQAVAATQAVLGEPLFPPDIDAFDKNLKGWLEVGVERAARFYLEGAAAASGFKSSRDYLDNVGKQMLAALDPKL
jgi:hypothetical protein